MSATNGERARFHRNRKKRVLLRMRLREVMQAIKDKKAANADTAPASASETAAAAPAAAL